MTTDEPTESAPLPEPPEPSAPAAPAAPAAPPRRRWVKYTLLAIGGAAILIVAAVGVLGMIGIVAMGGPDRVRSTARIQEGLTLQQQGDLQGAIAKYTAALEQDPTDIAALVNRANAYDDSGDPQRALADYDAALRLNPNEARVHRNRGATLLRLGKTDEAFAAFSRAIELDPAYARAWASRGDIHAERKDPAHAIEDYSEAIRLEPRNGGYYGVRARQYGVQGRFELALADAEQAVALRGQWVDLVLRGAVKAEMKDCAGGLADMRQAQRIAGRDDAAKIEAFIGEVNRVCSGR